MCLSFDLGFLRLFHYFSHDLGARYGVSLLPDSCVGFPLCDCMRQLAQINRRETLTRPVNPQGECRALVTQVCGGKAQAVGSAVPLFQTFLALMAAAVPYRSARLVLIVVALTKPFYLPWGQRLVRG